MKDPVLVVLYCRNSMTRTNPPVLTMKFVTEHASNVCAVFECDEIPERLVEATDNQQIPVFDTFEETLVYLTEHMGQPAQLRLSEVRRWGQWGMTLNLPDNIDPTPDPTNEDEPVPASPGATDGHRQE